MKYLGVSSWRGWGVTFSDGMCTDCAGRARAEWRLPAGAAAAIAPVPVPRMRRALRPDFALATAVLLLTIAVAVGVAVGPPPRTVWEPTVPATTVAGLDGAATTVAERPSTVVTATAPRPSVARPRDASDRVAASVPTGDAGGALADATDGSTRARVRPVRVVRASAKRPAFVAYQPMLETPLEYAAAAEPAVVVPPTPPATRLVSALARIGVQAP